LADKLLPNSKNAQHTSITKGTQKQNAKKLKNYTKHYNMLT